MDNNQSNVVLFSTTIRRRLRLVLAPAHQLRRKRGLAYFRAGPWYGRATRCVHGAKKSYTFTNLATQEYIAPPLWMGCGEPATYARSVYNLVYYVPHPSLPPSGSYVLIRLPQASVQAAQQHGRGHDHATGTPPRKQGIIKIRSTTPGTWARYVHSDAAGRRLFQHIDTDTTIRPAVRAATQQALTGVEGGVG